jgi:hypothetical protein
VTAGSADVVGVGVRELVRTAGRLGLVWTLRPATVVTVSPLTVMYDGDTVAVGAVALTGQPMVGGRVHGLMVPPAGNFALVPTGGPHRTAEILAAATQTSGSYGNGTGTVCGVSFTAPSSGQVTFLWGAEISNSLAFFSLASVEVKAGSVVDSGDLVMAASDDNTARVDGTTIIRSTAFLTKAIFTPGREYNVTMKYRVAGGTGTFNRRKVTVVPA